MSRCLGFGWKRVPANVTKPWMNNAPTRFISDVSRNQVPRNRRHEPLRVLFCGSDEFSIHSLLATSTLQNEQPEIISSIDVVCRPDKRTGRGLKTVHEVPIKSQAKSLGCPLHQIDTFTGWTPPSHINLIVAVSFGLLVPPRILNGAKYGGLNVHPSLLPDLRGPAPIVHTLLQGRKYTGVTLQTMHPSKFDHGLILDQTPLPGIPVSEDQTVEGLTLELAHEGGKMLRNGIENELFLYRKPVIDTSQIPEEGLTHASKIDASVSHIDWSTWDAERILRYGRLLDLWDTVIFKACTGNDDLRVKFHGPWHVVEIGSLRDEAFGDEAAGRPGLIWESERTRYRLVIKTCDGKLVSPEEASIEGKQKRRGLQTLVQRLKETTTQSTTA